MRFRRALTALALAALCLGPARGEEINVPLKTLEKAGIDTRSMTIIEFSDDGHQVLSVDRPPVGLKVKGEKVRVWLLSFDSGFKFSGARKFPMDIPPLEQAAFTPDGKSILVITRQGTDFFKINLADGKVSTVMSHVKGHPGFRSTNPMLAHSEGKLLTLGWFYDETDIGGESTLVEIDPSQTGVGAFKAVGPSDVRKIENQVQGLQCSTFVSPKTFFFYGKQGDDVAVYAWTPAEGLKVVDRGKKVPGCWSEQTRTVYSLEKPGGQGELVLLDSNSRRLLGTTDPPLVNLGLANSGLTLAGYKPTGGKGKYSLYTAESADGFQLRVLKPDAEPCVLRISPGGEVIGTLGMTGLTLYRLR